MLEHGAHRSASGRGNVDAYAGDLITTNPGEVHDGRPIGGPSRRWRMIYLDIDVVASMRADVGASTTDVQLTRPVIRDATLRRALHRLFRRLDAWSAASQTDAAAALACEEALVHTCALLLERHGDARATPEADDADVRRVRDRLAGDLLAPPTLSELATMAGLSKYQLLRRFERSYGVPPHAWLMQQRTERARTLIRNGTSLAQAATLCGFSDQSHMARLFVRQFGFTPGVWQRATARVPGATVRP